MNITRCRCTATFLILVAAAIITSCGDDDTNSTGAGNAVPVTAASMETYFNANKDLPLAFIDAFKAANGALRGTPSDAVTLEHLGGDAYRGAVSVDMDHDGAFDLTINGTANLAKFRLEGAKFYAEANYSLTGLIGAGLSGSGSGDVTVTGGGATPTIFQFNPGSIIVNHDDGSQVRVTEMGVTVDITFPDYPHLYGYICFTATGGGSQQDGTVYFDDNGAGGWFMRVEGDGWDFDVQ